MFFKDIPALNFAICARVDQLLILGMVIPPSIGNPKKWVRYVNPYYWVHDHPLRKPMGVWTPVLAAAPHASFFCLPCSGDGEQ